MSGIAKLAPILTAANCYDLLARAQHKTKRKIEELVAEVAPKPDVPSTMRKLPVRCERYKPVPMAELRPDTVEAATQPSPGSRYISAPVKRFVWKRDGGRCTDLSSSGRRCIAREGLEFHHDDPYGFGGDRTTENVRMLCKVHNALRGERDFGKGVMDQYRRSDDHVSEPLPVYYVSTDRLDESNLVQTE